MSPILLGMIMIVVLFIMIGSSLPVALGLGISAMLGLLIAGKGVMLGGFAHIAYFTGTSFVLLAGPLFIFMGALILHSGIGAGIYQSASLWTSRLPGGLRIASTLAGGVFGAMCGASAPGTAAIGIVALPEMTKRGYSRGLAAGSLAATGGLAMIIPPSLLMIIYGEIAYVSVGKLFIAGVIPGVVLMVGYSAWAIVASKFFGQGGKTFSSTWGSRMKSLVQIIPAIILVVLVMTAIYAGIATPTEAAAVGTLGAFIIAVSLRKLTWDAFKQALTETVIIAGMLLLLVSCARYFGFALTAIMFTHAITEFVISLPVSPYLILGLLYLLLFGLGCLIDGVSMLLITAPMILPIVTGIGFDPVWYAVVYVLIVEVAVLTPPVGINLYVLMGIAPDYSIGEIVRGSVPFIIVEILTIGLVTAFPQIALWLPSLMK